MIYIVGLGPGNREYILPKALEILKDSDKIIGFDRAVNSIKFLEKESITVSSLKELLDNIDRNKDLDIAIIASGDPTFYGITNYLKSKIEEKIEIIPGISSFQYLTSKVQVMWSKAYLGSLHGRDEEFLENVKEHDCSIWLTDKVNNPSRLCEVLYKNNIDARVIVGENLSYDDEKISIGKPKELMNNRYELLSVVIIEKI